MSALATAEALERHAAIGEREEPKEAAPRLFRFTMVGDLPSDDHVPDWTFYGILEAETLALIYGEPGSCKTFVALDMALSSASGRDWHGLAAKAGPVLVIVGEGRRAVLRRIKAWCLRHEVAPASLQLAISSSATSLTDEVSAAELLAVVSTFIATHGRPVLVVVDTLARNFGPGDENSQRDMSAAVASLDRVKEMTGATVLVIHHSGHADKMRARGSTVLNGALDHEYRVARDPDGTIRFESTKTKDGEPPAPMAFRLESVPLGSTDDEGNPVTSAVVCSTGYTGPQEPVRRSAGGKNQTKALQALWTLEQGQRDRLAAGGFDPGTARVTVTDWREACARAGLDRRRLHEAERSLADAGKVRIENGFVAIKESGA